jgi:hypothetical protein
MTEVPRYRQSTFWRDLTERVLWTAVQAGVAVVTVEQFDLPAIYVPIFGACLAALKGAIAKTVVSPEKDSASTAPGV